MNPSSIILFLFFFNVFTLKAFSFTTQKIPYFDHCNSYVPEANRTYTNRIATRSPYLEPLTTQYTGGQNIFYQDPTSQCSIFFQTTGSIYATNVVDTYKVQAQLSFAQSSIYYRASKFTRIRSKYSRVVQRYRRPLVFNLDGFWSVSTNKLCMVGSARLFTQGGNLLKRNAVLKLKFPGYMTLNNSLVSGIMMSLASPNDSDYFDQISILGFPSVPTFNYNYTLVSNEECNLVTKTTQDAVISMGSVHICSLFMQRFTTFKLEYPSDCKNCSFFSQDHNGYLPDFMSLYAIQCSHKDKQLRFLVEFQDRRFTPYDQSFRPNISLIGEGTWNGTKDELCIVACQILNQSDPLGSAGVGDCSVRLTLWFPTIRSIMKTHTTEGQIWNTRLTDDLGSFRMAKFQSFDHSGENYGFEYEYTQMEKVRQICPKKKRTKRSRDKYQFGYYGFDMFVKHKNMVSSGYVVPMFVGNQGFSDYRIVNQNFIPLQKVVSPVVLDTSTTTNNGQLRISFEISFMVNISSISGSGISSLILSSTEKDRVEITAEGVYDDETEQICMVGCRNLIKNASFDCEILVKFQLPQGRRSSIKGSIESLRKKSDVLYFEKLDIGSLTITVAQAIDAIWIMDIKLIMRLISNTLVCVFTLRQLFHLKKKPEMTNFISVMMMMILTLGHVVPLVLNLDAIFSDTMNQQIAVIGRSGLLVLNEAIVRMVTIVAFILQFRLLQLTWIAKKDNWIHEKKTLLICIPTYVIGGLVMLLVKRKNNYVIGDFMRSYAGLILDGFLFPQLILNIFQISKGDALSHSFYIGTTLVRLMPHAYDLYKGQEYIRHQLAKVYIYANPSSDFYSPSWDIVIVCGGLVFVVIVFLQQHFGGRFMFPKRYQEHVEYKIVPVTNNE